MIRTIIVDDEVLSRIGIRSFIDGKEDIKVLGVFGGADEALGFLRENVTDVVITDIEMADMSGLDLISAVREESLAPGIIIVSCHDNFSYAQEAISKGTNSYLLKMDLTEEMLIKEVKKVYAETAAGEVRERMPHARSEGNMEEGTYVIVIPRVKAEESGSGEDREETGVEGLDGSMLAGLLEEVVSRYQMGTLFSPYNREMFIIFRFGRGIGKQELEKELSKNLSVIGANAKQYINGRLIFGVSSSFTDLKDSRGRYDEAKTAADLDFYDLGREVYTLPEELPEPVPVSFSSDWFAGQEGLRIFTEELHRTCAYARRRKAEADRFRNRLIGGLNDMTYRILHDNRLSREFTEEWNISSRVLSLVTKAKSLSRLEQELAELFKEFHEDLYAELNADEFSGVFRYIEQNLDQKISLTDLAEIGCMSIPSMSKKFKERTGLTITQYVNRERIRRARILMKNPSNSLWQIAEITGFANVNYMIRVFKKVTGMTVGEYRRQLGISAPEEEQDQILNN